MRTSNNEKGQTTVLGVLAAIGSLILVAAIVVGTYQAGWWLKKNAVNRNAAINRMSYEVQQTYHEEVLKDLDDVSRLDSQIDDPAYASQRAELRAERLAAVRKTCDHISRLTTSGAGIDPDIEVFHTKECVK